MCEPFSVGAVFASVGSAFKFADLAVRIAEVGSENEVFVRTIHVVRDDLKEVERLLKTNTMQRKLASTPGKTTWVSSALDNTRSALNEIGKWVERARAEQESTGSIQFNTRVRWVFNDHEKILNRTTELMTCHQQLSNVLSYLIRLEDIPTHVESATYQVTTHFDDIISRHKRKSIWKSSDAIPAVQSMPMTLSVSILEPHLASSPETFYPHSPPPTYASTVQSSKEIQHTPLDAKRYSDAEDPEKNRLQLSSTEETYMSSCKVLPSSNETWAYQLAQTDLPVSELAGDTVQLSGTNAYGPVNPYEYCTGPQLSSVSTSLKDDEHKAVAELLGDLNFAVELPSNDPGPPPGYPRRSDINPTFRACCNNTLPQDVDPFHRMPLVSPYLWSMNCHRHYFFQVSILLHRKGNRL
ncbi:Nn.00g071740.m01.CDS01 [Neocucurbitaria sp. VM-36]